MCTPPDSQFLGPTHIIIQPKRHLDWFSHFCTAHGRASLYFTVGRPFPFKTAPSPGESEPHLIHDSLAYPSPQPNNISSLWHSSPQSVPILYNWLKTTPSYGGIWTSHLIHGSLVPPSPQPKTTSQLVSPLWWESLL